MKPIVIISTFPNRKSVTKLADELVSGKIVACVNVLPISSIYSWNGNIERQLEYLALFKTTQKNKQLLKKLIKEKHPYEVPEIAEINIAAINSSYLKWLVESTK